MFVSMTQTRVLKERGLIELDLLEYLLCVFQAFYLFAKHGLGCSFQLALV